MNETESIMLENFLKKYGNRGLNRIAYLFLQRKSNQQIAEEFKVTRQRVHQWQRAFTRTKVFLRPLVEKALKESS